MVRVGRYRGQGFRAGLFVAAAIATGPAAGQMNPAAVPPDFKAAQEGKGGELRNAQEELNRSKASPEDEKRRAWEQEKEKEKEKARKAKEDRAKEERAKEERAKEERAKEERDRAAAKEKAAQAAASAAARTKPGTGARTDADAPPPGQPVPWRLLWRVRVGLLRGRHSQIAVRGPLVVVASVGEKRGPDPLDGVYVIDGRSGGVVRTIHTNDDAYGVGLHGDVVVFAVGKRWERMRLDGWPLRPEEAPEVPADAPGLHPPEKDEHQSRPAIVVADLIAEGALGWTDLAPFSASRETETGAFSVGVEDYEYAIVMDEARRTRAMPLPVWPVSAPSVGDVDGDGSWDVVIAAGEYVYAFATGSRGKVGRAFWTGDIEASGRKPRYADTPATYAARLPARDVARWLVPDAAPAEGSGFQVLAGPSPALPAPSKIKLTLQGGERESEDATPCADQRFAIDEGRLIREERAGWRLVKGAPFPVARLVCSGGDGYLQLVTANQKWFRLPPPLLWRPIAWGIAAAIACALAGLAIYMRWRINLPQEDAHTDVRRRFISDAPRGALENAHPDQVRLVKGLAAFIDNDDTKPPMTLALYGKWGSGKSSIMKMLCGELGRTGRYIDVWFNAWRFQNEDRLAPALLQSIVDEIGRKSDWMTRLSTLLDRLYRARARDVLTVGAAAVAALAVFIVSVRFNKIQGWLPALGAFVAGLWRKVLTPLFKVFSLEPAKLLNTTDSGKRIGFMKDFGDEFRSVIRRLPKHTRLIVYVDDLDRCSPDRIVPLLETLNMLADTGCGLFVIATDRDAVRRAVELVHKETIALLREESPDEARRYGDRFLEKIVTVGINVPQVKPTEMRFDEPKQEPESSLLAQLGRVLRKALRPRPGWAFFVAFLVAIGGPLWAAGRYIGEHADPFEGIGKLLGFADKPAGGPAAASKTGEGKPAAGGGSVTVQPTGALPPEGGKQAPIAGKLQDRSVRSNVEDWIGTEIPPVDPRPAPTPAVAAETERNPSEERRFALALRHFAEGLGLLALVVIGGVFWAQAEQRRRIAHAPPMAHDSEAFAAALKLWSGKLPNNPRTAIRFNNAARFLYHLVGVSHPTDVGWEPAFFQILFSRWNQVQKPEAPAGDPEWLAPEMQTWISAEHRTFSAEN